MIKPAIEGKFKEVQIELIVVFDCHVVTEKIEPQPTHLDDADRYWNDSGMALRQLCDDRYLQSFDLRGLINEAASGSRKCYTTNRNNALIWKMKGINGATEDYVVYFTLTVPFRAEASKHHVLMYVQSAYNKSNTENKPKRDRETKLITLCTQAIQAHGKK